MTGLTELMGSFNSSKQETDRWTARRKDTQAKRITCVCDDETEEEQLLIVRGKSVEKSKIGKKEKFIV